MRRHVDGVRRESFDVSSVAGVPGDSPATRDEVARIIAERDITSLYQPIVDLRTGDLVGCEVLSRGPEGSPLFSAGALFGAATAAGLLAELDLVCRILGFARALEAGGDPGLVFVNVEPGLGQNLSMNSELAAILRSIPFQAVVELTERALTHQPARLLTYGDNVRDRGNLIAIDDLGADPHSLALVPLIKPDILKLDLAVVQGTSPSAGVTAAAAWEYADRTGAIVLAEGIETEQHLARAVALGATWGQGYLFARPGRFQDVTSRRRAASVVLPWAGARRDSAAVVTAPAEPRRISRLMLTVLSDQLEIAARGLGPHGVLVASVENAAVLRPRLLERYSGIAERAAFVGIVGPGVSAHPCPGVHGGDLDADGPLTGQWSVAVLGPHFGAVLTAVPDPDEEGSYRAVYSFDPVYAASVAEQLTRELIPQTSKAVPAPVAAPQVREVVDFWPAITAMLRRPGIRAAAIGRDGLVVDAPPRLAALITTGITGPSLVNDVVAGQRERVVATWLKASSVVGGSGGLAVRTVEGRDAWLHFIDVRADHGVHLAVLIPHKRAETAAVGAGRDDAATREGSRGVPDHSHSGWLRKDERALILEADSEACAMLGYSAPELAGLRTLELIHPDDRDVGLISWIDMLSHPGKSRRVRLRHRRGDGSYLWCEVVNHNALTDPHRQYVLSQLTDVDAEVTAQHELAIQQRTLRTLAETLTAGIALVDATGHVAYANAAMLALTGPPTGGHVRDLLHSLHPADLSHGRRAYRRAVSAGQPVRVTVRVTPPGSDESLLVRLDISPTGDGGAVACAADVTEETRLHEQLERQATRDALTGCWNRTAVLSLLEAAVAPPRTGRTRRHRDRCDLPSGVAVLYVDLDGFKAVNDDLGHASGDAILIRCAERLRAALRDSDDIGRLGGDEFLLLCRNVTDQDAANVLADHVRTALAADDEIPASVGVVWTGVPVSADGLVARADIDMYASKTARRALADIGSPVPL
jgi:diguanylate cyclase (GGDEF)-like protein/PAS domain S-box-containing protein